MSAAKALIYLALWAALIALCSYLAPYCGNDLRYMLIEGTDDLVNSVGDVFISQYRHYFDWGGRTVNHVIAQLLLYLDKPGQSIIQGLTFALLVWAIAAAGAGRWHVRQPLYPLIFITLMLWLCLRNFGEVVINMVSSANYLYSTLLVLIFLIPFRQSLRCAQDKRSWAFALQMFPLGIIAGWTNENTGFAAVCMVGLYNLRLLYEKRLTAWQFTGGVGLLIGYVLLMAAPGNEARMEFMEDKGFNFWDHFIHNSLEIVGFSFITQHLLLISAAWLLYLLKCYELLRRPSPEVKGGYFLCAVGFLSLLIMLASPTIPARSAAPFTIFVTAGVLCFYQELHDRGITVLPRPAAVFLCFAGLVFTVLTAQNAVRGYAQARLDNQVRGMEIITQLRAGQKDLVLSPFNVQRSRYIYLAELRTDKTHWSNAIAARFYRVNTVVSRCDPPAQTRPNDFVYFAPIGHPACSVKSEAQP